MDFPKNKFRNHNRPNYKNDSPGHDRRFNPAQENNLDDPSNINHPHKPSYYPEAKNSFQSPGNSKKRRRESEDRYPAGKGVPNNQQQKRVKSWRGGRRGRNVGKGYEKFGENSKPFGDNFKHGSDIDHRGPQIAPNKNFEDFSKDVPPESDGLQNEDEANVKKGSVKRKEPAYSSEQPFAGNYDLTFMINLC